MPGLVGHDFGDAIRFGANYVAEDSREYEKAGCSMELFSAFTRGFLSQTRDTLTTDEIRTLPLSVFTLAVELASRFLVITFWETCISGRNIRSITWCGPGAS